MTNKELVKQESAEELYERMKAEEERHEQARKMIKQRYQHNLKLIKQTYGTREIQERKEELYDMTKEIKQVRTTILKELRQLIYLFTGEPRRITVNSRITIKEGDVYRFNKSTKSNLNRIKSCKRNLMRHIEDEEHQEILEEVLDSTNGWKTKSSYRKPCKPPEVMTKDLEEPVQLEDKEVTVLQNSSTQSTRFKYAESREKINTRLKGKNVYINKISPEHIHAQIKLKEPLLQLLKDQKNFLQEELDKSKETQSLLNRKASRYLVAKQL